MKKNRSLYKGLALLLAAVLTAAFLSEPVLTAYAAQDTAADTRTEGKITISSREEFLKLAQDCQDDFYSYGKVFSLETDIDLAGTSFQGIPYFQGTLEGNGHRISGLLMLQEGSDQGLFRYVGKAGKIKDLHVSGRVELMGSGKNAGGIAGVNYGILENCSFDGKVTAQEAAGGIAGVNREDGIIMSCTASGSMKATNQTGGICGLNRGIVQKCTNSAAVDVDDLKAVLDLNGLDLGTLNLTQNVVTRNDLGGIAGRSSGTIADCVNEGRIGYAHVGYNAGGIVGRQSGTVISCVNKGEVLGRKDVGGIVGQAEPYRESEYLSEHLEKVWDDFAAINHLMGQMADAASSVSEDTKGYVKLLQDQYEDTIDTLDQEIKSMRNAVSDNNASMAAYMDSLSEALKSLSNLGDDTISRLLENLEHNMKNAEDKLGGKLEDIGDVLRPEKPEETQTAPAETEEATETETEPEETEKPGEPEIKPGETEKPGEPETKPGETEKPGEPETKPGETEKPGEPETKPSEAEKPAEPEKKPGEAETKPVDEEEPQEMEAEAAEAAMEEISTGAVALGAGAAFRTGGQEGVYFSYENSLQAAEIAEAAQTGSVEAAKLPEIDIPGIDEIESEIESGKEELENKKDQIHDIIHNDPIRYERDNKINENMDGMKDAVNVAADNIKNMQGALSGTGDSVSDAMSNISGELNEQSKNAGDTIDGMTETINQGIQSVSHDLDVILNTSSRITNIIADDMEVLLNGEGTVQDVSSEDITRRTLGVLTGCENHGKVEGDINAGGIAGTMNVEYDIDPEADMDFSQLTDIEVRATTNAVLLSCKNYGRVTGKKENCGGVAGSENLGLISGCENYGMISLKNGSCLGGIAGYSDSRIDKGSVLCNLEGGSRLGGIAGEGYDISRCLAAVTVSGDTGEKIGSIAGTVNEKGTLRDNYFVTNPWGGVDRVNYAGKAESCSYEEILQKEGVSEGFLQVTVTFEKEDEILKTMQIPYGGTVTAEDAPDTEAAEDSYLKWDHVFPVTHVTTNLTVTAENKRWTKSMAYLPENSRKADFLVEGDFYDSSALLAENTKAPKRAGMEAAYAYRWRLEQIPEERSAYTVHFRIPEGADSAAVMICQDGQWKDIKTEPDGSYVTASVPAGAVFAVYAVSETISWQPAAAAGTAAVVLLLIIWAVRKKRKK